MKKSFKNSFLFAAALIFLLSLAMFGQILFSSKNIVISNERTDIFLQFIHWREFGFSQLRRANLPLWNPYIFSGMPYLGESQSALFYPLNIIFLFLPVHKAINISIALHVFLAGIFMYLWASHRRLHQLSCLLCAALFMFCGAYFLHIYAGHIPNLSIMVWAPLLFLAIDGVFEDKTFGWVLMGMFVIVMLIFAGHPQYFFYISVASVIYVGLMLLKEKQRLKVILKLFIMWIGGLALSSIQIFSQIQATQESIRATGVPFKFAAMFSFAPENFITLLVPNFFGNDISFPYWGRCYFWEMSLFISVTGLILFIYGSIFGDRTQRSHYLTMTVIFLLLALGAHTPIFYFLYKYVPGFNLFRGNSKFIFLASLFMILLSGLGLDQLIRSKRISRTLIIITLLIGLALVISSFYLQGLVAKGFGGAWYDFMQKIPASGESYLATNYYKNIAFTQEAGLFTSGNILIAGEICLLLALLFILRRFSARIAYLVVLIAIAEIFIFARNSLVYFDPAIAQPYKLKQFIDEHPGDYRVLYLDNPNSTISIKVQNIWGHDPGVLKRYAEFMAFTQGANPDKASQYLNFSIFHPLYKMLRCRYAISNEDDSLMIADNKSNMPRLLLLYDWIVIAGRDKIFQALQDPNFDPLKTVILEKPPEFLPVVTTQKATFGIIDSSTDYLIIEADLSQPAILLITDSYSKGWRTRALPGSAQKKYEVVPANYILRAISLSKGYHLLRLEYMPAGITVGKWLSCISLSIYIVLAGWYVFQKRTKFTKNN